MLYGPKEKTYKSIKLVDSLLNPKAGNKTKAFFLLQCILTFFKEYDSNY